MLGVFVAMLMFPLFAYQEHDMSYLVSFEYDLSLELMKNKCRSRQGRERCATNRLGAGSSRP